MHLAKVRQRLFGAQGSGQATVEFALAGTLFLVLVLGTIDFGRCIFLHSQLTNGVRDSARVAKVSLAGVGYLNYGELEDRVRIAVNPETSATAARPGLQDAVVSISCSGGCDSGDQITVSASVEFQAVTQSLLGIDPFTLRASATTTLE